MSAIQNQAAQRIRTGTEAKIEKLLAESERTRSSDALHSRSLAMLALEYSKAINSELLTGWSLYRVAFTYTVTYVLKNSLIWFKEARQYSERIGSLPLSIDVAAGLANTYSRDGRLYEALEEIENAIQLSEKTNDQFRLAKGQMGSGSNLLFTRSI